MPTLRMCPSCGAKDFDLNPPAVPLASTPTHIHSPVQASQAGINPSSKRFSGLNLSTPIGSLPISMNPAPLGSRFLASSIDLVIVAILQAIPVSLAYLLTLPIKSQPFNPLMSLAVLAAFLIPFFYYTLMPASKYRATYGKKAMGLMLLTLQGETLTKIQAFIRVLLTMIIPVTGIIAISVSFGGMAANFKDDLAASAGIAWVIAIPLILWGPYLTVFFNPLKQTLFDMVAKTIVVKG